MKQSIKLAICQALYYSGILHLFLSCLSLICRRFPALIVNYHSFVESLDDVIDIESSVTHPIAYTRNQLAFLKKYFEIVSLDNVITTLQSGGGFNKPTVAITIDDGLRNAYDLFFPLIKEEGLPITIFLTAELVGTNKKPWFERLAQIIRLTRQETLVCEEILSGEALALASIDAKRQTYQKIVEILKGWDAQRRDQWIGSLPSRLSVVETRDPVMLTWDQVREMQSRGVDFGAHTCTHPILTKIRQEEAEREILHSKEIIEKQLGCPVNHFAYPNGRREDFNEKLQFYCQSVGFKSLSTTIFGVNRQPNDVWQLKRIGSCVPISVFAVNVVRAFFHQK